MKHLKLSEYKDGVITCRHCKNENKKKLPKGNYVGACRFCGRAIYFEVR